MDRTKYLQSSTSLKQRIIDFELLSQSGWKNSQGAQLAMGKKVITIIYIVMIIAIFGANISLLKRLL